MKTDMKYAVAVLVDGDNASFENLEDVMGVCLPPRKCHYQTDIRRLDAETAFRLEGCRRRTRFPAGTGLFLCLRKNTTDIALVIDAMDILRDGLADCFCLVASDGDYTPACPADTGSRPAGIGIR